MPSEAAAAAQVARVEWPEERQLWVGLLAGPAVWSLQELFGWFFGARICASMSIGGVRVTIALISLAALLLALAGTALAWRNWRRLADGDLDVRDRRAFMALGGVLVGTSSSVAIVWAGLSAAMLSGCGWAR